MFRQEKRKGKRGKSKGVLRAPKYDVEGLVCKTSQMQKTKKIKHVYCGFEATQAILSRTTCTRTPVFGGLGTCGGLMWWSGQGLLAFTNSAHNRLQQLLIIVKLFPTHANSHTIPNLALRVGRDIIYINFGKHNKQQLYTSVSSKQIPG